MNAASASLGTVLVQRLDALLGTTLSQQSNLVSGARPDAVSQPAQAHRSKPADNPVQRSPQENIHRATARVAARYTPLTSHTHADAKPSTPSPASVELRLGATARLILDLLTQYPQHMPVQGKTPLLDFAPGQTAQYRVAQTPSGLAASAATAAQTATPTDVLTSWLRQALVQLVHTSGMFYESHLAQLALGARRAASMHEEPQAHARARANVDPSAIAPETQTLIRQQLEVLAHQTFAWQGPVWPQTNMRWEIQRHPSAESSSADMSETPAHWASHLTLDLPTLGRVHAQLTLSGEQVLVHLQAADCAPQLQQHADALRQRLARTGLRLTQLSITENTVDAPSSNAALSVAP